MRGSLRDADGDERARDADGERDEPVDVGPAVREQEDAGRRNEHTWRAQRESVVADGAAASLGRRQLREQRDRNDDCDAHGQPPTECAGEHRPRRWVLQHEDEAWQRGQQLSRDEQAVGAEAGEEPRRRELTRHGPDKQRRGGGAGDAVRPLPLRHHRHDRQQDLERDRDAHGEGCQQEWRARDRGACVRRKGACDQRMILALID